MGKNTRKKKTGRRHKRPMKKENKKQKEESDQGINEARERQEKG